MLLEREIAAAYECVEQSSALRARLFRKQLTAETGLHERERLLVEQKWALSAARAPLRQHLLRTPCGDRMTFAPDVRAASDAITAERKRLDRMLYGKPGKAGYAPPKKPQSRVPLRHLTGTINQIKGVLAEFDDLPLLERFAARPRPVDKAFAIAKDARELRDKARSARLRIGSAQQRFKASYWHATRLLKNEQELYDADAEANVLKKQLLVLERRASKVALVAPGNPVRTERPEWTGEDAIDALDEWAGHNEGRWPTARQLPKYPFLPSRGTLGNLGISLVRDAPGVRSRP